MKESVRIVEVSPRDGLQNEKIDIPLAAKVSLIEGLAEAGLKDIEATSFVSPKWVPQLADADDLWPLLPSGPTYSALVPNLKGWLRAKALGVTYASFFTAASEAFTLKNINMSIEDSLAAMAEVMAAAGAGVKFRAYVSTAFECPYSGRVAPSQVATVVQKLFELGISEISIGDTTGVAVPSEVHDLIRVLEEVVDLDRLAFHFHDTRGTAVANVAKAFEMGIRSFDSSAGGLGGCPYAPGAGGNVATDDLIYFFERSGVSTGINPDLLAKASLSVLALVGKEPSKAQRAQLGQEC